MKPRSPHYRDSIGIVTVTDAERVIWTGGYGEFQRQQINRLSVSEFVLLEDGYPLIVTGMGDRPLCIKLDATL